MPWERAMLWERVMLWERAKLWERAMLATDTPVGSMAASHCPVTNRL